MPKVISYAVVGVVAFFVGGFSFLFISHADDEKTNIATSREFVIDGMSCQGCADTITSALTKIPGVQSAKVSLQDKSAIVTASESQVPTEKILTAITIAGYKGQLASEVQKTPATAATSSKHPILVNITRGQNELHAVSMALGLAQSAIKDGRKAVVFLNVESPVFAAKELDDELKYGDFPPIKKMLADFIATGGQVLVCEHCAHVVKLVQRDMIDGAQVVAHGELLAAMPTGTVIFSY
jgi:copper chaperone CopZ/predicted peroxiredoxin